MDKETLLYHYFSNSLEPADEKQFNELLKTDAAFREQFEFEKSIKKVILHKEDENLKQKLQGFEKAIVGETETTTSTSRFRKWSIAASIVLLMGLGWVGFETFTGQNLDAMYEENYQSYPNTVFTITRGDADTSAERNAFVAYESGDFQTAIDHFESLKTNENLGYVDFYLAQSYLSLENYDTAINLFNKVIETDTVFVQEANWYLALTYLKKDDKAAAIERLNTLVKKYDYNKNRANELLEKLR